MAQMGLTSRIAAGRREGWQGALVLAAAALSLAGCASTTPETKSAAALPVYSVPEAPPPSPEFNLSNAQPLPIPGNPAFGSMPVVPVPGEPAQLDPLPLPGVPNLGNLPGAAAPAAPAERATPLPRPEAATAAPAPAPAAASPAAPPPAAAVGVPPTAKAVPPTQQQASLAPTPSAPVPPSPGLPNPAEGLRLLFAPGSTDLPPDATGALIPALALLQADAALRIQLMAYASGSADTPVEARRISMARAVKVREWLEARGVPTARVALRPLGLASEGGPADRVDITQLR